MARSREFDPDETLAKVAEVFWDKGLQDTSIEDLVAFTGVSRSGLYQAFGNKKGLFLATLDWYEKTILAAVRRPLLEEDAGLAQLLQYLENLPNYMSSEQGGRGCLMCVSASEVSAGDPDIQDKIYGMMARLKALLMRAISNAQTQGQLSSTMDVEALALAIISAVIGMATMLRAGADNVEALNAVQGLLFLVDGVAIKLTDQGTEERV